MGHVRTLATAGLSLVVLAGAAGTVLSVSLADASAVDTKVKAITSWQSFISVDDLAARLDDPNTVVIDVRKSEAYAKGHIPGAITLPGDLWRTPSCRPGAGDSQYIFRTPDATPDIARYESLLGAAGVTAEHRVVIVGEHAGKADGSTPAMILRWLGHRDVAFLDGVGTQQWTESGRELSTEETTRPAATYVAGPDPKAIWNLDQVLAHLGDESVVFLDTRSLEEYEGVDRRNNRYGGRIPGAVRFDYFDLLTENKTAVTPDRARSLLAERGVTPDRTIVLYCQTATRVSLNYLVLKDLGFEKVAIYDASWHEYGNRDDTPIEAKTSSVAALPR